MSVIVNFRMQASAEIQAHLFSVWLATISDGEKTECLSRLSNPDTTRTHKDLSDFLYPEALKNEFRFLTENLLNKLTLLLCESAPRVFAENFENHPAFSLVTLARDSTIAERLILDVCKWNEANRKRKAPQMAKNAERSAAKNDRIIALKDFHDKQALVDPLWLYKSQEERMNDMVNELQYPLGTVKRLCSGWIPKKKKPSKR